MPVRFEDNEHGSNAAALEAGITSANGWLRRRAAAATAQTAAPATARATDECEQQINENIAEELTTVSPQENSPREHSQKTRADDPGVEKRAEVIDLRARIAAVQQAVPSSSSAEAKRNSPTARLHIENVVSVDVDEAEFDAALAAATKMLGRKSMSAAEVQAKLLELEFDRELAAAVVAKCVDNLYIDEAALAIAIVENHRGRKGLSAAQIRRKLQRRKLPYAVIEQALATLDEAEENSLLQQAAQDRAQTLSDLEYDVAKRRLLGFLARRGWGGSEAYAAAETALEAAGVVRGRNSSRAGALARTRQDSSVRFE